jgi:tRNA pseudouridine55 synthase
MDSMNGILNINKPPGMTSHDVVVLARRRLRMRKIGHGGTLDPQAKGVLLLLVGKATKISQFLRELEKEYIARMRFGAVTLTQDAWGKILQEREAGRVDLGMVKRVIPRFLGRIKQIPPAFSAIHHNGRRLYELAREGTIVKPSPRMVNIYKIEPLRFYEGQRPEFEFRVICGSGTYIRTLCHDLGASVGVGGYLISLTRTRIGPYRISSSIDLEGISQEKLSPVDEILSYIPT